MLKESTFFIEFTFVIALRNAVELRDESIFSHRVLSISRTFPPRFFLRGAVSFADAVKNVGLFLLLNCRHDNKKMFGVRDRQKSAVWCFFFAQFTFGGCGAEHEQFFDRSKFFASHLDFDLLKFRSIECTYMNYREKMRQTFGIFTDSHP